jgi:hypothetical protein
LFGLATILATFQKLGDFFQITWSPWPVCAVGFPGLQLVRKSVA